MLINRGELSSQCKLRIKPNGAVKVRFLGLFPVLKDTRSRETGQDQHQFIHPSSSGKT